MLQHEIATEPTDLYISESKNHLKKLKQKSIHVRSLRSYLVSTLNCLMVGNIYMFSGHVNLKLEST